MTANADDDGGQAARFRGPQTATGPGRSGRRSLAGRGWPPSSPPAASRTSASSRLSPSWRRPRGGLRAVARVPRRRRRRNPRPAPGRAEPGRPHHRRPPRRRDRRRPGERARGSSRQRRPEAGRSARRSSTSPRYSRRTGSTRTRPARSGSDCLTRSTRDRPADSRARRGRLPAAREAVPATAHLARLVRRESRLRRGRPRRRLRRAAPPRPAQGIDDKDEGRSVGRPERRPRRRDRGDPAAPRRPRPRGAAVPRLHRRPAPNRDRTSLQGVRRPGVLAARPPPPPHLASASSGALLGGDRPSRRAAEALDHGRHVHPRVERRPRDRPRGAPRYRGVLFRT